MACTDRFCPRREFLLREARRFAERLQLRPKMTPERRTSCAHLITGGNLCGCRTGYVRGLSVVTRFPDLHTEQVKS
jgi:hypothetical protein